MNKQEVTATSKPEAKKTFWWGFRYEGPSAGLAQALTSYAATLMDPMSQAQFANAQTYINAEQYVSGSTIRVIARGDERNTAIECNVIK